MIEYEIFVYLEEQHRNHHIDKRSNQRAQEEDFHIWGNEPTATWKNQS
jgi:hypothetical protein